MNIETTTIILRSSTERSVTKALIQSLEDAPASLLVHFQTPTLRVDYSDDAFDVFHEFCSVQHKFSQKSAPYQILVRKTTEQLKDYRLLTELISLSELFHNEALMGICCQRVDQVLTDMDEKEVRQLFGAAAIQIVPEQESADLWE